MSRYRFSFSERVGYENSPDITVPIALYTDLSFSVPIVAKLDCLIDHDQEFYLSHYDDV